MNAEAFFLKICGRTVEVHPQSDRLKEMMGHYAASPAVRPDHVVEITEADVEKEPEILALHRKLTEQLIDDNILLIHSSIVSIRGTGYAYLGKSGTGKSTHARLLREVYGEQAVMVNDDKPFYEITDRGVYAYGSPWAGKHRLENDLRVPVRGFCFLKQAPENTIRPLKGFDAFTALYPQVYRQTEAAKEEKTLDLLEKLLKQVRCFELECNMDPEAARLSYETMSRYSIREILARDGEVVYTTKGVSMEPLLRENRDVVVIRKLGDVKPKRGDVVLFVRPGQEGHNVLHRVVRVEKDGTYTIIGDHQSVPERHIRLDQIVGIMTSFIRDGKETGVDDPEYQKYVRKVQRKYPWRQFFAYAKAFPGWVAKRFRKLFGRKK